MENILGKHILMLCENDNMQWVEHQKVCHVNNFEDKFKIAGFTGPTDWNSKKTIVHIPLPEEYNKGCCLNCGLPVMDKVLCHDTYCVNDFDQIQNTGFSTTSGYPEKYCDQRLKTYPKLRENLWSREDDSDENTHMHYDAKLYSFNHGKYLPKSRFADRRLAWKNRGKRYNLHPHK